MKNFYLKKIIRFLSIFVIFSPMILHAQLSGEYTIGSGGDYASFSAAVEALNTQGVNGPVTFNVLSGVYNTHFVIEYINGASETNTVTFQSQAHDSSRVIIRYTAQDVDSNYVVKLRECSYVTLKEMTFEANGEFLGVAIDIENYAINCTVSNNVFKGYYNTNDRDGAALICVPYAGVSQLKNIKINNNHFIRGSFGIYINTGNSINVTPVISGNKFDSLGYCGVSLLSSRTPKIFNNTFRNCEKGIELHDISEAVYVYNNNISDFSSIGIYINNCTASQSNNSHIYNNMIAGGIQGRTGVSLRSSTYLNFYNNSIRINDDSDKAQALSIANGTNIKIINNILSIINKGIPLYVDPASASEQCDYNAFYTPSNYIAYWGKNCEYLHTLRAESGDNAHSIFANPNFASESDLHVNSFWLDGTGSNQFALMNDIDGEVRKNPPDIGADEFTASSNVKPPLSGAYVIGSGQDYATLQEALDDINIKGISDSVILQLSPGTYSSQYRIFPVTGASAQHPLIIESYGRDSASVNFNWWAENQTDDYIFHLIGASYIKFRHLTFESTNISNCRILYLDGRIDSLYVEHCRFTGREQTSSLETCALIYGNKINFQRQFIRSNTFNSGAFAIEEKYKTSPSYFGQINSVNNRFENTAYCTLDFYQVPYIVAVNNHIESQQYGINIYQANNGIKISGNYVISPFGNALKLNNCKLNGNNEHTIYNNFFMANSVYTSLVEINNCNTLNILYNNVYINDNSNNKYPIKISTSNDLDMRNNIFNNNGIGYSIYVSNSSFLHADYNDYYTNGTNMGLGYWNQLCPHLEEIRDASGMNEHSINVIPGYTSSTDLHVSSNTLNGAGEPIDGITTDFDGDRRHPTAPDIGADEFYSGTQNPPQRIAQIPDQVFAEDCGTQTIVNSLFTIFQDDAEDVLTFSAYTAETQIAPVIVSDSTLRLIVAENFNGANIPVYVKAADFANQAAWDTFLVTITPVPDRPVAADDYFPILSGDSLNIYPLENDSDPDGMELTILNYSQPQFGTATTVNDTMIQYISQMGFTGIDSFTYVIRNEAELTDTANVYIDVKGMFSIVDTGFVGVSNGSVLWGDYDNDKDLDLLVFGLKNNQDENVNIIYQNTNGVFTPAIRLLMNNELQPDNTQGAAWGDVDNDGNLDLLIAGKVSGDPFSIKTRLFINQNGANFTEYKTDIFDAWAASITFIDYDLDGDLDVFIAGNKSSALYNPSTKLYRNDGKGEGQTWIFTDVTDGQFPDLCYASAAWADYDNDGDQDLLLCGAENSSTSIMDIFRNNEGSFTALNLSLTPLNYGKVLWGDYDADGDLDILFSGRSTSIFSPKCGIYRNEGSNVFTLQNLPGTSVGGDAAWIDYDNDGDLDITLCGRDSLAGKQFKLFINNGNSYSEKSANIPNLTGGMAWGDYDNNGKADLCISGIDRAGKRRTILMSNNCSNTNLPPEAPTFAATFSYYDCAGLSWHPPQDDHTPSQSLTYNLMVGEAREGVDIISPASHTDDGYRKIVFSGNVGTDTSYIIKGLVSGKLYYFAVQAIDGAYAASPFYSRGSAALSDDFMEVEHKLPDLSAKLASADLNKDGKMDLMVYGQTENNITYSRIYQKETFGYSETSYNIRAARKGSVQWQDYNGDGDADLLITGFDATYATYYITKIAEFEDGQYHEKNYDFTGILEGDARWGDFDNDGDEDVLIIGKNPSMPITKLYENRDSLFSEVPTDFHNFSNGSIAWGDYDNDGDLDILITGYTPDNENLLASEIYRNDNGVFNRIDAGLLGVEYGNGVWGDFDTDGDLDILLCGLAFIPQQGWWPITKIYKNDSGVFTMTDDSLVGVKEGSVKWVDLNNDGLMDIIGNGFTNVPGNSSKFYPITICYINNYSPLSHTGNFRRLDAWLGAFYGGDIALGDIDGDLDVDIVQCGKDENYNSKTRVFRNRAEPANFAPFAPQNLRVTETDSSYIFSWDKASDDKTPQHGLTYNLRIGSTPGASDIKPCNSDTSGYHFVPIFGNVGEVTRWELKNPPNKGSIYWSVQTIDNNFVGSPFAAEQHIVISSVKNKKNNIPDHFALQQNYPNPFNPTTTIKYQLSENSNVEISVYNLLGEKVAVLVNKKQQPGSYSVRFDASKFSSGIYFYRIKAGDFIKTRKMVFIR